MKSNMKPMKWILACLLGMASMGIQAQTQIVAHRGYWKCEGSAQNSIASLQKAAEAGVYGSELDVQLTKDKEVVVNHDDTIKGIAIADARFADLKQLTLDNGEPLPTLDAYLEAAWKLPDIQLILEIKPHRTKAEEDELAQIVVEKVKKMQMEKQVEYISFSMNVCEQLVKLTPGSEIAYLKSDVPPRELKAKGINGIDYYMKVFEATPEWIEEAHSLGMKVNVWTVNDLEEIRRMIEWKVDYITTDCPVEAQSLATPK